MSPLADEIPGEAQAAKILVEHRFSFTVIPDHLQAASHTQKVGVKALDDREWNLGDTADFLFPVREADRAHDTLEIAAIGCFYVQCQRRA